jgi:hypothetical protein
MRTAEARQHLERRAAEHGLDLTSLRAPAAVDLVLGWFERERTDDARPLDEEGDGILFQWGTYGVADSLTFQYDLTRQFIFDDAGEQSVWQLSLTLHFAPTSDTERLGAGSCWCFDPSQTPSFRQGIEASPASACVAAWQPAAVTCDFVAAC